MFRSQSLEDIPSSLDILAADVQVGHGAHGARTEGIDQHAALARTGAERRCIEAQRGRQVEDDDVRLHPVEVDLDGIRLGEALADEARVHVVVTEATIG